MAKRVAARIQGLLAEAADPAHAVGASKYLKGAPCRGVRAPAVAAAVKSAAADLRELPLDGRVEAAHELMRSRFVEDQNAGARVLRRDAKALGAPHVDALRPLVRDHFSTWAATDALGSALGDMIRRPGAPGDEAAHAVARWKDAENMWVRRTACVAFVVPAYRSGRHHELIDTVCTDVVLNFEAERFVHLGAGWAMRQVGVLDPLRTVAFLRRLGSALSREGLRYAAEKMPPAVRGKLMRGDWDGAEADLRDAA